MYAQSRKWNVNRRLEFEVKESWRHQRGNQKPCVVERQFSDRKEKDKHNLQNTTEKIKNPATRFPLQPGGEFDCSLMYFFQIIVILPKRKVQI